MRTQRAVGPGWVLLAVALVAAACAGGAEPSSGDPVADGGDSGTLEVVQELECCYIEGSLSHVRLQTEAGRVVAENEFSGGPLIQPALEVVDLSAGTYVLESWQRPCEASCPPSGGLDAETDRCRLAFDLAPGQQLQALVEVTPGEGCTITVGDEVAQTTGDGAVHAFEAGTGRERWRAEVGGSMLHLLAVGGGHAYVATSGRGAGLHAIDLVSGEVVWRHETPALWPPGGAVVAGDTLYATGRDGTTLALDTATGHERWRAATPGEGPKTPTAVGDVLVVATDTQGNLFGLDTATGEQRWRQELPGGIPAAPAADAGDVYVTAAGGTRSGRLVAVDAASGVTNWHVELPGSVLGGAAVGAGEVFAGSGSIDTGSGTLQAFAAATGALRWSVTTDGSVYNTPVLAGDLVLAADLEDDGSANLYAFRRDSGELEWTTTLPAEMLGTPIVDNGRIYLTAHPAHVVVLNIDDGRPVSDFEAPLFRGDVDDLTPPRTDGDVIVFGSS